MKLSELAVISAGQGAPQGESAYGSDGVPFIKAGDLASLLAGKKENEIQHVNEAVAKKHKLKLYPAGSILFAKSGMSCMKGYVYKTESPCYVVSHLAIISPTGCNGDFLKYYFQFHKPNSLVKDPAYPSISLADIGEMDIHIPSCNKQQEIVNALEKVTELITLRREQLLELDHLVKSRFIELFGDPVTNPKGWPVRELSEYIQFLTSGSRGWAQYFTESGEYFITIKNVKNCRITLDDVQHVVPPDNAEAKRTRVHEGDLLISITADLGRTGVVTKDIADYGGYINQHLTCIRLKKDAVRPLYVAYYMESEAGKSQFQSKNQSAVKAGLNFNSINSLRLMVPPVTLQDEFIAFVEQTDKSKLAVQKGLQELEILKKSLMQQYFG